ncbi:class I SAM-dependent methyltransferase [Candidatus Saccharibacteria bacterium]|nr:class I SAM-dependent methyltransferase [Candidatus Saccharibacteria bacterium]
MPEVAVFLLGIALLYSLKQGAPYVPTKRQGMAQALKLLDLPKGSTIVDIGSGDGRVLRFAAEHGYRAVGIELNPVLWWCSRLLSLRHGQNVQVELGNLWRWQLPAETRGVFIFSAEVFTERLAAWLQAEHERLGHPLKVVTYGAQLPGRTSQAEGQGCSLYIFD